MHHQLLRGLVFVVLVLVVTSDLRDIVAGLTSSSSAILSVIQWINPTAAVLMSPNSSPSAIKSNSKLEKIEDATPHHGSVRKIADTNGKILVNGNENRKYMLLSPASTGGSSTTSEEEKKKMMAVHAKFSEILHNHCLPKLVCELHASVSEHTTLTKAEKNILTLIKDTSLGSMGEIVSRYHFAAHMGQLLSGVEGNGCHNIYPSCPLSGNKVLKMVKSVRV